MVLTERQRVQWKKSSIRFMEGGALILSWLSLTFAASVGWSEAVVAEGGDVQHRQRLLPLSQVRRLEDEAAADEESYDLSQYAVRFGRCQRVKTFSDNIAWNEDFYDSVFASKSLVVYRLCPVNQCRRCDERYGEYVVEAADYLKATAEYQMKSFQRMCERCQEECEYNDDDGSISGCEEGGCGWECYKYDNLESAGYADAANYAECQRIEVQEREEQDDKDKGDDDYYQNDDDALYEMELYIGPRCHQDGTHIYISLFLDENCWIPYEGHSVEDVVGLKMSYHLLKNTYRNYGEDCISCDQVDEEDEEEDDKDDKDDDDKDGDNDKDNDKNDEEKENENDINEMCQDIYQASAKCESPHGITSGFIQSNREEGDYENQVENEFQVCTFINSLMWNSYTETGEINIFEEQDVILRVLTWRQKVALSLLIIVAFLLAAYAAFLHRSINVDFPDLDLSCQGHGQMT